MKVLIDMKLSPSWATVLNEANIEAVHWSELGPANTPDRPSWFMPSPMDSLSRPTI
jgi:predicted nuclease of predicted toxin-antitoxin system